jgi:hypothetical protein
MLLRLGRRRLPLRDVKPRTCWRLDHDPPAPSLPTDEPHDDPRTVDLDRRNGLVENCLTSRLSMSRRSWRKNLAYHPGNQGGGPERKLLVNAIRLLQDI